MMNQRMPSVMKHNFSQVPHADIQRSSFNRSHGFKATFDAGQLIPVLVDEVLPGDTFNCKMQGFARLATPIHPIMDNMYLDTFFFFVPNRLLWDNWEKFNGEQTNPGDSTDYLIPTVSTPVGGITENHLFDYMGLPTKVNFGAFNNLHGRAYNLIYNEWFRDENLQDSLTVPTDDGPDTYTDFVIRNRGKRHDYFTSALPWPQKGDAVNLPLGSTAPVGQFEADGTTWYKAFSEASAGNHDVAISNSATAGRDVVVDLADATAATINELREAFQIQKLYERDARGGTRYTEIVKSHFGVTSPDARLQRPEYLGGGSQPILLNPVAQTSSTDGTSPQAHLAAVGTVSIGNNGFTKSFTEHGVIIGLACVRADLNYQQGLNRMWTRQTRWDYYWPALAHLGEQAVLNKEIYTDGSANDELVFGYQERYAEYRYKPSVVTGAFRSNATTSLDPWHLAQDFSSLPVLDDTFIQENPPLDRCIAVPSEPHFKLDSYFNYYVARPMPTYSVPGLIDHF